MSPCPACPCVDLGTGEARGKDATAAAGSAASGEPNGANAGGCIAIFDKRAELVLVGHGKGTITVLDAVTLAVVDVVRVSGSGLLRRGLACRGCGIGCSIRHPGSMQSRVALHEF